MSEYNLTISFKIKKLKQDYFYSNQLMFFVLDNPGKYSLIDIHIDYANCIVYYILDCKKNEYIGEIKQELCTFIKDYKEIKYHYKIKNE
jgi:hypothetical protein